MRKLSMVLAVAAVVLMCLPVLAGERERRGDEPPNVERGGRRERGARHGGGMRERMMQDMPAEIRELMQKRCDGKKLTDAETKKLDEFREQRRAEMRERFQQARGERGRRQRGPTNPLVREKLNPADTALQTMAEVMLKAQKFEQAIKVLERMTKSPDPNTQASAHFNIASICRKHLGDTDSSSLGLESDKQEERRGVIPEFGSSFSGLASDRKLTDDELIRAIRFMIAAEYEAIQFHMQLAESTDNRLAIEVLKGIADEERVHAGEFLQLLRELAADEDKFYAAGANEVQEEIEKLK